MYIDLNKENNKKCPKFKVADHVRISKCKNIFAKCYAPNWDEGNFVIKKAKNTLPWTYDVNDVNGEELVGIFYGKGLPSPFRVEKVIKRKRNKLYIKWIGYNNS